jgi:hypothetical protein
MSTIVLYAAHTERMLNRTAFAARTALRKARASKRNVATAISASIRGKLPVYLMREVLL